MLILITYFVFFLNCLSYEGQIFAQKTKLIYALLSKLDLNV